MEPGPFILDHPTEKLFRTNGFSVLNKRLMVQLIAIRRELLLRGLIKRMELITLRHLALLPNLPQFVLSSH